MSMRYKFSFFLAGLLGFSLLAISPVERKNSLYSVRVLLDEKKVTESVSWDIESEDGFFLADTSKNSKVFYFKSQLLAIQVKHNFIYVNGKKYVRKQLKIAPKSGYLSFSGNSYQGDFIVALDKKNALLINKLDLEDYIFAVLRSESWPGWPIEVNKAFSVAIRSYVISRIKEAKKCSRLYHIKNDNSHQTYNGHEYMKRNSENLRKAVKQTEGVFLTYNNEPIEALYDSCCGGVVPAHISGKIDFTKAPYLKRQYSCKYCRKCSLYQWQVVYTLDEMEKILSKECPFIKNIKSIWISKKDKAGLVKEVTVRCARKTFKISGEKLYSFLKAVKSFCFSIKKRGKTITMNGKGYGHHIGLCQWGARQMVRELCDYKQILQFYYPGTQLVKLS